MNLPCRIVLGPWNTSVPILFCAGLFLGNVATGNPPRYNHDIIPSSNELGVYNSLAQFIHDDFKNGDFERAALQARILEISWSRFETEFKTAHPDQWQKLDDTMHAFISPILRYKEKMPDRAALEAAFRTYVRTIRPSHDTFPDD